MELAIYKEPNSIVKSYEQSFDQTTDKANQSGQCLQEDRTHQIASVKNLTDECKENEPNMNRITPADIAEPERTSTNVIQLLPTTVRECYVCMENRTLDQFDGYFTRDCQHTIRIICNECLYKTTHFVLKSLPRTDARCPEPGCNAQFTDEEIHQILQIESDLKATRQSLELTPTFSQNTHLDCSSSGSDNSDTYNSSQVIEQRRLDDNSSTMWIQDHTKQCPQCHRNIEKIGGCDLIKCSQCNHQFCWECLADYKLIMKLGLDQHRFTCSHHKLHMFQRTQSCTIL